MASFLELTGTGQLSDPNLFAFYYLDFTIRHIGNILRAGFEYYVFGKRKKKEISCDGINTRNKAQSTRLCKGTEVKISIWVKNIDSLCLAYL